MKLFIILFTMFIIFIIFINRNFFRKNFRKRSITDIKLETYEEQIETLKNQIYELKTNGNRKHPILNNEKKEVENPIKLLEKADNHLKSKIQNLEEENRKLKQQIKKLHNYIEEFENIEEKKDILKEEEEEYTIKIDDDKNDKYRIFVAGHYKLEGYDVSLNNQKKDDNYNELDIICKKDDTVIFLKTESLERDEQSTINLSRLENFVYSCEKYIKDKNILDKNIKLRLVISNDILDYPEIKYIKQVKNFDYEVL